LLIFSALFTGCSKNQNDTVTENLLENTTSMDLFLDTGCLDFGVQISRSHLLGRWSLDKTARNGTTFTISSDPSAVEFTVLNPSDRNILVRCRPEGTVSAEIIPVLNGKELPAHTIVEKWQDWNIPIAKEDLHVGQNVLALKRSAKSIQLDVDSICFTSPSNSEVPGRVNQIYKSSTKDSKSQQALIAPPDSMVNLHFKVPADARLKLEYGLQKESSIRGSVLSFDVFLEDQNGTREKLLSKTLQYGYLFSSSRTDYVDLKRFQDRIVRVSLKATSVSGKPIPSAIVLREVLLSYTRKNTPQKEPLTTDLKTRNVFIYLVDTLRANHLEPYGYKKPVSPRLKDFAKEAVLFERAYSQTTWTRSSIACIQAGVFQSSHLVETRADILPDFLPTIQSVLESHGYSNYGFVTNANLVPTFNFGKHYRKYFWLGASKTRKGISSHSGELFHIVERELRTANTSHPLYMYIHAMDPHWPYTPDAAYPGKLVIPECDEMAEKNRTRDCLVALYDSEIYNSDFYFGKFIDLLRELNLYQDALIVFTGDHGESLGDHGAAHHGKTLYEAEIRVPLLIKFPQNRFAGKRISETVRHIDIFPTVLKLFSFQVPPGLQGRSLLSTIAGTEVQNLPVFSELSLDKANKKSMVYGGNKVIANYGVNKNSGEDFVFYEMYDVLADPDELVDISKQKPILFGFLRTELEKWARQQSERRSLLKKPKEAVLDDETKEILRSLGYLQ
jgi:arylsulfatase A-like enzyme